MMICIIIIVRSLPICAMMLQLALDPDAQGPSTQVGGGGTERCYTSSKRTPFFRKVIHIPPPHKPLKSCCDCHPYPTQEADLQTKFHSLAIKQTMFVSASTLLLAAQIQRKKKRIFTASGRDLCLE